jgi:hypothetical protein
MESVSVKKRGLLLWQDDRKLYQIEELGYLPYLSLGRLYASKGMLMHAVRELEQALRISPGEPSCVAVLQHIRKILN